MPAGIIPRENAGPQFHDIQILSDLHLVTGVEVHGAHREQEGSSTVVHAVPECDPRLQNDMYSCMHV